MLKKVLTIAGSDCSGGAGIQADLKTITAHKMYGMAAITALTAQNTMGVSMIEQSSPAMVEAQLDSIFADIAPDAIKIGMVSQIATIRVIKEKLVSYQAKNIVVDPVMVATSGADLINEEAVSVLSQELFSIASLITPNLFEAQKLSGIAIRDVADMKTAAKMIFDRHGCPVLIKGGHLEGKATDVLCRQGGIDTFEATRIDNDNTHGTGCTLSSAIACNLAKGMALEEAVAKGKEYLSGAIAANLNLGLGRGPLNHMYALGIED